LRRAKEPYYRMIPYRNRSDGSASWQSKILYNAPNFKGRVACGANRIGKSSIGAFESALMVTGEHPRYKSPQNGKLWIVGVDSKAVESVCRPAFETMIPQRYKDGGKYNGKNWMWSLKSDGRSWEVWFKSVDSGRQKFQGEKLDYVWVDEEPLKEDVFREIELRLTDNQGIWLMTATPVEGTKWLKNTLERSDVYYTMAGMRENPYIPMEEIEKIAKQMTEDERMVRIEGKYIIFGGRPVFDRTVIAELELKMESFIQGMLIPA
jgi:phage terminase large subunit-like protein